MSTRPNRSEPVSRPQPWMGARAGGARLSSRVPGRLVCTIRFHFWFGFALRRPFALQLVAMLPYAPESLPVTSLDYGRLIRLIGPANAALARYDGLLQSVVNPSVMLSPLTNQEAVLSSKIEGTQATVDEVLEYEAGIGCAVGFGEPNREKS